ncbi:hypothetical protein [Streptomyces sp. NPDC000880]
MPNTVWTLLVAALTALVTTVATGLLVTPRLEARKRRIQEVHTARDTFSSSVLTILSSCSRLKNMPLPAADDPDCSEVLRARLAAERERWVQQLDDATLWMIDHMETFGVSWPSDNLRSLIANYVVHSRIVMLSEREEAAKVDLLLELAEPIQNIFFVYWWRRAPHMRSNQRRLTTVIEALGAPAT